MMRKVPLFAAQNTLSLMNQAIQPTYIVPEKLRPGVMEGLTEDVEPVLGGQEQWIRSKITVEIKYQNPPSHHDMNSSEISRLGPSFIGIGTHMKAKAKEQEKSQKRDLEPAPIDLNEPLDISFNEEEMRQLKERQTKEKQDLEQAEKRRRQRELKEEQLKYEMIAKDKKSKQFTYDYDGKLIPVNSVKTHKLPASTNNMVPTFPDDPNKGQPLKNKKKGGPTSQHSQPNVPVGKKRTPEEEKEFVKFVQSAPPVLDTLVLQPGVLVRFDGKLREGPRPQTVEVATLSTANSTLRMPRKDYFDIIKTGNLNRQAQTATITDHKHASDKTRDLDPYGTSVFNMERLRRQHLLQQQQERTNLEGGGIKINSTKIFETLTNSIPEEDELQQSKKPEPTKPLKLKQSPIDDFNVAISNNQNWGKEQFQSLQGVNKDGLLKVHPREKDTVTTIGNLSKKPRDRQIPSRIPGEEEPPLKRVIISQEAKRTKK